MKTVHENPFNTATACSFCGKMLKNDSSLRSHVYKFHNENRQSPA